MSFLLQVLVNGLGAGAIYGLVAVGYSLTYTTTRTLNFALGMWVMLGGMLTYTFNVQAGFAPWIAGALAVTGVLGLGLLAERVSVHPFLRAESDLWVMSTLAVGLLLVDCSELIWGRELRAVPPYLGDSPLEIGVVSIRPQHLLAVVAVVAVFLGLDHFYHRTLTGKAFRAVAYDREASALMGVNVRAVESWSFGGASALAALAGFLVVPITGADPHFGTGLGFKAFAVAIIAGLSAPRGILVCGLLFGAFEGLVSAYFYTGIRDILGFGLMIVALFVRPEGLFVRPTSDRVL